MRAVLEVDEGYLAQAVKELEPSVVVLLNLSRDQLDRVGEVRMVASRWKAALSSTDATIVANADDPLVAWAAGDARSVVWVTAGGLWHADSFHCPNCDARISFGAPDIVDPLDAPSPSKERADDLGDSKSAMGGREGNAWSCSCGFARPRPDASLSADELVFADGRRYRLALRLPGRFNRANAAMAGVAATLVGTPIGEALDAMARVEDVAGRFTIVDVGDVKTRLLLAKNPAGFTELITLVCDEIGPVVIGINSKIADGRDPSWLWDVPFDLLKSRPVVATGGRCRDLAVRLRHAGVAHVTVEDPLSALHAAGAGRIDFIGNYTAFQELRRQLKRNGVTHLTTSRASTPPLTPPPDAALDVEHLSVGELRTARPRIDQSALRVVVVHPDLLGTYGDGGNAIILSNRALWRNLPVELVFASSDRPLPASGDIYCLGGGEDGPQVHSAQLLGKGVLRAAVTRGAVVIAVCAGYQIIGESFADADGIAQRGVELLDAKTVRGKGNRAVGEMATMPCDAEYSRAIGVLSGFENHAGVTLLGRDARPFAKVLSGVGNGFNHMDGAWTGRVFGTYLHGPILARNPKLADLLLSLIDPYIAEIPLDDSEEDSLRNERLKARSKTKSPLRQYLRRRASR
jgi:CobQ-like glutamine amidotransferase family enzyme